MIKHLRVDYRHAFLIIISLLVFTSCRKDYLSIQTQLQTYTGNLKFEFVPGSSEEVFYSQTPWEAKALNYYNIIQEDTANWQMFYNAYAYNQLDFEGSFCLAKSVNGQTWDRPLVNDNTNILLRGENKNGVTGNFVFIDSIDAQYHYKMLCTKLIDGLQKTFLYASHDGLSWILIKQLFDTMQDSQFSAIRMNGVYYVFSRYNDYSGGYQRAVGLSILDDNMNVIQPPLLLLEASRDDAFPHIYNSAASKINDSTVLLFPTYFNSDKNTIRVKMIYTNNLKDYYLIDDNISDDLFAGKNVNWAIVCPGLIPAQEDNTYWLYYFETEANHSAFNYSAKVDITYYRIKLVVH